MANAADYVREIADSCRSIPADFGLREHSVSVRITTWSGCEIGVGGSTYVDTPILVNGVANPKVAMPSQRDIVLGLMGKGDITVGPFTPAFPEGGVDRSVFTDGVERSQEMHFIVTGPAFPEGVLFRKVNANVDKALRITLTLTPVSEA
jgi:hypothetical protein